MPGDIENSIEQAKLAREKIGQLINEHGDEAHSVIYGRNTDDTYRETVLERALIQYGNACSQLYGTYARGNKIGLGTPAAAEDPDQLLVKEAIAAAERMMKLNPDATEPLGQIAHYYLHLGETAIYEGNKDQAIDYLLRSTRFTGELRELHSGAVERWMADSRNKQYLAQLYLEKPTDLAKYRETINTLGMLRQDAKLINHEFRSEIIYDIWYNLLINYKVLAGFGEYAKALAEIDRSIETFPDTRGSTKNGRLPRRELQLIHIDRLSLLKLMNTAPEEMAIAEAEVEMMMDRIDHPEEKALARAYFELFRPEPRKRSAKAALQWLGQLKDPSEFSFIKEICEQLLGQTAISKSFEEPEIFAKRRCTGTVMKFHKMIFEVEMLINQGKPQEAKARMKSIDAWLENDKVVPCYLLLRVKELRESLMKAGL